MNYQQQKLKNSLRESGKLIFANQMVMKTNKASEDRRQKQPEPKRINYSGVFKKSEDEIDIYQVEISGQKKSKEQPPPISIPKVV